MSTSFSPLTAAQRYQQECDAWQDTRMERGQSSMTLAAAAQTTSALALKSDSLAFKRLNEQLEEQKKVVVQLTATLKEERQSSTQEKQQFMVQLEEQKKLVAQCIAKLKEERQSAAQEKQQLIAQLEESNKMRQQDKKQYTHALESMNQELVKPLQENNHSLTQERTTLYKERDLARRNHKQSEETLTNVKSALKQVGQENQSLSKQLQTKSAQLEQMRTTHVQASKHHKQTEEMLTNVQSALQQVKQENQSLAKQLQTKSAQLEQMETTHVQAKGALLQDLRDAQKLIDQLREQTQSRQDSPIVCFDERAEAQAVRKTIVQMINPSVPLSRLVAIATQLKLVNFASRPNHNSISVSPELQKIQDDYIRRLA